MKTAITQAIADIADLQTRSGPLQSIAYGKAIRILAELLEVEKEQLKTAYNDGIVGGKFGLAYTDSEHYFDRTFETDKH